MTRPERRRSRSRTRWLALAALVAAILVPAGQALIHRPGTEPLPASEIAVAIAGSAVLAALVIGLALVLSRPRRRRQ